MTPKAEVAHECDTELQVNTNASKSKCDRQRANERERRKLIFNFNLSSKTRGTWDKQWEREEESHSVHVRDVKRADTALPGIRHKKKESQHLPFDI